MPTIQFWVGAEACLLQLIFSIMFECKLSLRRTRLNVIRDIPDLSYRACNYNLSRENVSQKVKG